MGTWPNITPADLDLTVDTWDLQQILSDTLGDLGTPADGFDGYLSDTLVILADYPGDIGSLLDDLGLAVGISSLIDPNSLAADAASFPASLATGDAIVADATALAGSVGPPPPPSGGGGGGGGGTPPASVSYSYKASIFSNEIVQWPCVVCANVGVPSAGGFVPTPVTLPLIIRGLPPIHAPACDVVIPTNFAQFGDAPLSFHVTVVNQSAKQLTGIKVIAAGLAGWVVIYPGGAAPTTLAAGASFQMILQFTPPAHA